MVSQVMEWRTQDFVKYVITVSYLLYYGTVGNNSEVYFSVITSITHDNLSQLA